jgi:methionyl aminopeptidase
MIFIKTATDIDGIKKSCQVVADVLRIIGSMVKPGVSTMELNKAAEDFILTNCGIPAFKGYSQAGSVNFPASICTSVDFAVVHGIPNNKPLVEGQILSVDVGVKKNGYYGDAARTFAVGKISDLKMKLMKITEESFWKSIEQAVHGSRVHNISFEIQKHVEGNGFSVVRDLCGHGVGKFLHEDPSIPNYGKPGTGAKLKNGMTLAIEPMVNAGSWQVSVLDDGWTVVTADGEPSAHYENTILVTNGEPEILTL